jgi:diguanylate cyclase (GGDEF)-like protein
MIGHAGGCGIRFAACSPGSRKFPETLNTRFGHLTGDFVLTEIASVLKSSIRASDAVVRYGGDEFLIILSDTASSGAEKVIERIHQKFDEWNDAGHLDGFRVSVSIGSAEWHEGETLDEMLDKSDQKMYIQKKR